MRGLFTAGVMDVMMEHDIRFDGIVGVSAGATFGCNYKSHQVGRVLRYNVRFKDDPRYMGLRSLLRTGDLVAAEFSYHTLPNARTWRNSESNSLAKRAKSPACSRNSVSEISA